MQLTPIEMGTAPFHNGEGTGLIGVPVWMWVEDPSPRTFGPNTRSASAGSVTVTVTAEVQEIGWTMGDGSTVTCTSPGTAWTREQAGEPSPTCGHVYDTSGEFGVTATSHWVAEWQSTTGATGTIEVQLDDTVSLTIAEARSDLVSGR